MRIYNLNYKEIKKPINKNDWIPSVSGIIWSNSDEDIFFYNVVEEGYLKLYEFHFNEEDITKTYFFLILTNDYTGSTIKLKENKYLIEYSSFTFPNAFGILQTEETSKILTCNFIKDLKKEKLKIMKLINLNLFIINLLIKTVIQCFIY
jgi:hypothetical protein